MDEPLIHQERRQKERTRQVPAGEPPSASLRPFLGRRGEALITGSETERAAALVDIAEDQEGLPRQLLSQPNFATAAGYYLIHNQLNLLWLSALASLLLLNFVELPSWCTHHGDDPCGITSEAEKGEVPLGGVPFLPRKWALVLELTALGVLFLPSILFPPLYLGGWRAAAKSGRDVVRAAFWLLLLIDTLIAAGYYWGPLGGEGVQPPFRLGPYLRVLLIVASVKQLRDAFRTVLSVLPQFGDVVALLVIFLGFSSWLAFLLFEDTPQGESQFTTYGATFEKLSVLLTGSDNPDIYMPAYRLHRAYSLFFVLFLLIGATFLLNLVLAVIYDAYKSQLAERYSRLLGDREETLKAAFQLLDKDKRGYLDSEQFTELFHALNMYRVMPYVDPDDMHHIFLALDDSGDYKVSEDEFMDLSDAIGTHFVKTNEPSFFQIYFPRFWQSAFFTRVRSFVDSPRFDPQLVTAVLLLNLVTVAIESSLDIADSSLQGFWLNIELAFGWLYFLEMALKIAVHGFSNYWRSKANRFDFLITWIIVIGQTILLFDTVADSAGKEVIRYLLIIRMLRLTRVLASIKRYRVIVTTFLNLVPALTPLLGLLLAVMSLFASLGVHLFGGMAYSKNPRIQGTNFAENYLEHNFNDFPSGMITLFDFITQADWNSWMQAYVAASGSGWARLYFGAYMLLGFVLAMNLLSAFVLEAFTAQRDLEEEAEGKSESGKGKGALNLSGEQHGKDVRVVRSGSVQRLMRQMLGSELKQDGAE